MTRKDMAPFPTYPPKVCENPDCAETCFCIGRSANPEGRHVFSPTTPWQRTCCAQCRNRKATLKRKAKKESEKSNDEKPNPS